MLFLYKQTIPQEDPGKVLGKIIPDSYYSKDYTCEYVAYRNGEWCSGIISQDKDILMEALIEIFETPHSAIVVLECAGDSVEAMKHTGLFSPGKTFVAIDGSYCKTVHDILNQLPDDWGHYAGVRRLLRKKLLQQDSLLILDMGDNEDFVWKLGNATYTRYEEIWYHLNEYKTYSASSNDVKSPWCAIHKDFVAKGKQYITVENNKTWKGAQIKGTTGFDKTIVCIDCLVALRTGKIRKFDPKTA